jgi:pyruvate/2-oxoacid:ferredoxin oxidoreductase beta subunit
MEETIKKYKPQDFKSDQEIRWCAGCGDIAIINAIQKAMAELDHNKEDYAIISGIWMFFKVSLLHEHLWVSWNSWTCRSNCLWC